MARPGPKPTPTALKVLRGNPGRRPLNGDEPEPAVYLPDPPSDLKGYALEEWQARGPQLERLGLITESDIPAFESYCRAWGRYRNAEDTLAEEGEVFNTPSGYRQQNPYRGIANKALEQCRRFWEEFAMMPASRSRVHVKKGEAPPQSKLDQFMRRVK